ncbi:MAG: AmmeMemoRadiSam system protein B [Candidatus Kuenenbacteria bacterium]
MKKYNLKLNILIILSLCLTGLIVFGIFYFLRLGQKKSSENIHSSNPIELEFFETAFKFNKKELDLSNKNVAAGIIPHHLIAADLAAEFFYHLGDKDYETIILLGPNHFNSGNSDIITSNYNWQTPYGILECDHNILKNLSDLNGIRVEEEVIKNEHSINSEVSFVKKIFPDAQFLPIILKQNVGQQQAEILANKLFELSKLKKVLVLASVDFSHYKDSLTAQKNDQVSIEAVRNFAFDKIYSLDIDSPASIYTLLKFSQLSGAKFELLNNSNSAILANKPDLESTTSYVTGYFTKQDNVGISYLPENINVKNSIRMLFFGDLMLDRYVAEKIKQNGIEYIFEKLDEKDFFENYNLISANLEGAVTDAGKHYPPLKEFDFAFSPEVMAGIKDYNFNFFNLANNHFGDQGTQGVNETRENLDKLDFNYIGCENGIADNCSSKVIALKDKKIGMVGLSVFWNKFDSEKAIQTISELKRKTDLVIVNIHWGDEYKTQFNGSQQKLAYTFIDYGADIIIGHHPHVVQGIEVYKNKPIFYSLGNFVFDQYFSEETQKGLAVEFIFKNDELNFKLHPLSSQKSQVNLMASVEKEEFLQKIVERSALDEGFKNQIKKGFLDF